MKLRTLFVVSALSTSLLLAACGKQADKSPTDDPARVDTGDVVTVNYTVQRSDEGVFASNASGTEVTTLPTTSIERRIQAQFVAGDDDVLWGESVVGLTQGDSIQITIDPQTSGEETYYDTKKVQEISATAFGTAIIPSIGDVYDIGGQRAWITDIDGAGSQQVITFDLNPRETWDSYTYEITVTDLENK